MGAASGNNDNAWTGAADFKCVAIGNDSCRTSAKLAQTFVNYAASLSNKVADQVGKNRTTKACELVGNTTCRNTVGVNELFYQAAVVPAPAVPAKNQSWTSANNFKCTALSATTCRDSN